MMHAEQLGSRHGRLDWWRTIAAMAVAVLILVAATPAQAQTYTILHNFTGYGDGGDPWAPLTMDAAGNFYGTTQLGGSAGYGVVFKLSHQGAGWILSTLYTFQGGEDGAYPLGGVTLGPDGSLYGTTNAGGVGCNPEGCGTVFKLRPSAAVCRAASCPWTETVLYRFTGGSDGAYPSLENLIFDQAGNLYGTTAQGGINRQGLVFELIPSNGHWTENVLYRFTGNGDGLIPAGGVTFDNAGNLYGTCAYSSGGGGTVYELSPSGAGWTEKTLHSFVQSQNDGFEPSGGVVIDAQGNLYGTTEYGGYYQQGTAYQLSPSNGNWNFTLLHSFEGNEGPGDTPTLDAAGNVYGTSQYSGGDGLVFELSPYNGGWNYSNLHVFDYSDGYLPYASVIFDRQGNLYGTTSEGGSDFAGVIFEITPN